MGIPPRDTGSGLADTTGVRRRLAAILAADIKGYSTLMDGNEEDTHRRVGAAMDRLVRAIETAGGAIFSFAGDGLMAGFPSAVDALKCALRVQAETADRAERLPPHQRIQYRMGINAGEVLSQAGHTGGIAVNIAARLEQIADPGSIFLSEAVYDQVNHAVPARYDRVGQPNLKNLREPVVVFAVSADSCLAWAGQPVARDRAAPARLVDPRASLAVLPVRVPAADAETESLAEGIADDIVRLLGGSRDLIAVVRTATAQAPRAPADLKRIRHALDVRYVLHGTLRRSPDQIRLSMELTEADQGRVIWSERIDGPLSEPSDAQDRLALRTAAAVVPAVLRRELARIAQQPPDRTSAYDLTLQAADLTAELRRETFHQAPALLRQALTRDAAWRPAHTHAAWWHATCLEQGWSAAPQADTAAALHHVQAALALDRDDPHALAVAGHLQGWFLRDPRKATGLLERALAAGPACAWSWSLASLASACAGDGDTAFARAAEAVRLAPLGPDAGWHEYVVSVACHVQHRYEDAVHWGIRAADRDPNLAANLRCLTASLAAIGHWQEARRYAGQVLAVDPAFRVGAFRARAPLAAGRADRFAEHLCEAGLPA